jgi:hypothetical protein
MALIATSDRSFLGLPYKNAFSIYGQGIMMTIFEKPETEYKSSGWVPQWIPNMFGPESTVRKSCKIRLAFEASTPHMWSSLRYLAVISYPRGLRDWQEVCSKLGAHLPPSQLTLYLTIIQERLLLDWHRDSEMVASTKKAFRSMLELPVLKKVLIHIAFPCQSLGLHRKRLSCSPTERRSPSNPFRFMDLPIDIQYMIIERIEVWTLLPLGL